MVCIVVNISPHIKNVHIVVIPIYIFNSETNQNSQQKNVAKYWLRLKHVLLIIWLSPYGCERSSYSLQIYDSHKRFEWKSTNLSFSSASNEFSLVSCYLVCCERRDHLVRCFYDSSAFLQFFFSVHMFWMNIFYQFEN